MAENRFAKYAQKQQARQATHTGTHSETMDSYVPGDASPLTEAFGGKMVRAARGLGNTMLRLGNYQPEDDPMNTLDIENVPFFGDKAIREQDAMDAPLKRQPGAGVGGFLGEVATLPAAPGGAAVRGAGALARTTRALLGARAPQRAVEGLAAGAIHGQPGSQDPAESALFSTALGRMGDVAGRVGRGVVKKSDAAQHLEHLAGQHGENIHIPLSLSADKNDPVSAAVGGMYRNVSPLIPFMSDRLEGQRNKARTQLRNLTLREASPTGLNLSPADLENVDQALGKISKEFIKQYDDTVKSYAFNVPSDLSAQIQARIRKVRPNVDKTTLADVDKEVSSVFERFSDGTNVIQGDNLLFARKALGDLIGAAKPHEKDGYKAAVKWIDDHIVQELQQGNKKTNIDDLRKYLELSEPWKAKVAAEKAARRALRGEFGPEDLYRTSRAESTTREVGRAGSEVLQPKATIRDSSGKTLANLGFLGAGVGSYMAPAATTGLLAGGHLAANKSTQRLLTGDTKAQRALQQWLESQYSPRPGLSATRRAMSTGEDKDGRQTAD